MFQDSTVGQIVCQGYIDSRVLTLGRETSLLDNLKLLVLQILELQMFFDVRVLFQENSQDGGISPYLGLQIFLGIC